MTTETQTSSGTNKTVESLEEVTIRLVGDSGDGMQLAGTQFTRTTAIFGNDVCTFPDYPAEIRAPAGSLAGVSGFQISFSSREIYTPGDLVDVLVAFNPAALKTSLKDLKKGGLIIVNDDSFGKTDLKKAEYEVNPLEDGSLNSYKVIRVPVSRLTHEALATSGLGPKEIDRCKNFFALGVIFWLYGRSVEPTTEWINEKFGKNPVVANANKAALRAGCSYGETCELFHTSYNVDKAPLPPGKYRRVSGNEATALGLVAAALLAGKKLFYGSYPITPASDILHTLSRLKNYRVRSFQAEDEIAAVVAIIGAAYAGEIAATGTSGPGLALKSEGIGLAVMTELPIIVVDVQRGGPSTGLPTKTEQADLLQALFGRHGECPLVVLAASSPADCFDATIEACRLAVRFMTPVMLMTDGYIANGEEPWLIPDISNLPKIEIHHPTESNSDHGFLPYQRNEELARPWALPGTVGLEHRIGGLEKKDVVGTVCYDPANHQRMVELREQKIAGIAKILPQQTVLGPEKGELLVVGWGGTGGAIRSAVERVQRRGGSVAWCQIRYLNPMPTNLGQILANYRRVLVPELNLGQLRYVLRAKFGIEATGLNKVQGKPFLISEIEAKISEMLSDGKRS